MILCRSVSIRSETMYTSSKAAREGGGAMSRMLMICRREGVREGGREGGRATEPWDAYRY
jgi:hypothetical protein